MSGQTRIDRAAVGRVVGRERARYADARPASAAAAAALGRHWLAGVPMHWMRDWPMPFPLVVREAQGATLVDADGHRYADFCLGDTGAMFGHAVPAVVAAVAAQARHGLTYMLPSADAEAAGDRLAALFGLPAWQVTQTATDANRAVIRWARGLTGRPLVLVFDGCYHGTVDDTLVALQDGRTVARPGLVGPRADLAAGARVVEFNDLAALEAALAPGDVACVLCEPVMTNCGMVLPEPGFHVRLRELTRRQGTLLVVDETHTLSSGYGGYTRVHGLEPDLLVVGKSIAGGVPCAVYGASAEVAARMEHLLDARSPGHSGLGTTLAASALALAALRASLEQVITESAYAQMNAIADRLVQGLDSLLLQHGLPWHVSRVGARVELGFRAHPPRTGRESVAAADHELEQALHLWLLNRGVVITPFHNMMLASPATEPAAVERLLEGCAAFVRELDGEA